MLLEQRWRIKKDPVLYLLDIAILLALYRQLPSDYLTSPSNDFLNIYDGNGPLIGLSTYTQYPHERHIQHLSYKSSRINYDDGISDYQTIMDDAHRRIPRARANFSDMTNNQSNLNVTAMMLQIFQNRENSSDIEVTESETTAPVLPENYTSYFTSTLDIFNDTVSSAPLQISDLLLSNQPNELEYNNADDVRWRDYLNENNNSEALNKISQNKASSDDCIDGGYMDENNTAIFCFNDTRIRTTSVLSEESGIEVTGSPTSASGSMNTETTSNDNDTDPLSLRNLDCVADQNNVPNSSLDEDADLMQMMYEQDVDLGFDWHHINEPVKQIKEIDDIPKEKNNTFDIGDFFVDGETGEHIPIARNQSQQPPAVTSHSQNNYVQPIPNTVEGNNALNIDDCLEILENSFDDIQPQRLDNQMNVQEQSNVIKSLTSLINHTDNSSAVHPDEDIWQQISSLSDLTGMNLQGRNQSSILNANVSLTNATVPQSIETIQQPLVDEPYSAFNQINYNNDQQYNPTPVFEPQVPQYNPAGNFPSPVYSPPVHTSPNYAQSPVNSEDGMPMDVGFSPPGSSPDKQEQNFLFNQLNNFNYGVESGESPPYGGSSPMVSSFPEPGQGFFDQPNDTSSGLPELVSMNSSVPSFTNNMNGSYLNPPLVQYQPPLLSTISPSIMPFSDEPKQAHSSTVDKSALSEYCESDSGISLDQSPRGYGFLGSSIGDETSYHRESQQPDHFQMRELKAIQHNHTYDGTVGAKKPISRNKEQTLQNRESRDERKARELNLPLTLNEIILSPVEDYNEMLVRTPLNPAQQALIKDIRRRGKNKVAAQNCRKRKIETISNMEEDVDSLRSRRQQLVDEQNDLESQKENMKLRYNSLYQRIFCTLRDDAGRPYDPNHFRLEQVEGAVLLVPRLLQDGHIRDRQVMEQDNSSGKIDFSKVKIEKQQ